MIRPATSRTCPTEPGAPDSSPELSVCTESITHASGAFGGDRVEDRVEIGLGEDRHLQRPGPRRSARSLTCSADSSPLTYSVR